MPNGRRSAETANPAAASIPDAAASKARASVCGGSWAVAALRPRLAASSSRSVALGEGLTPRSPQANGGDRDERRPHRDVPPPAVVDRLEMGREAHHGANADDVDRNGRGQRGGAGRHGAPGEGDAVPLVNRHPEQQGQRHALPGRAARSDGEAGRAVRRRQGGAAAGGAGRAAGPPGVPRPPRAPGKRGAPVALPTSQVSAASIGPLNSASSSRPQIRGPVMARAISPARRSAEPARPVAARYRPTRVRETALAGAAGNSAARRVGTATQRSSGRSGPAGAARSRKSAAASATHRIALIPNNSNKAKARPRSGTTRSAGPAKALSEASRTRPKNRAGRAASTVHAFSATS